MFCGWATLSPTYSQLTLLNIQLTPVQTAMNRSSKNISSKNREDKNAQLTTKVQSVISRMGIKHTPGLLSLQLQQGEDKHCCPHTYNGLPQNSFHVDSMSLVNDQRNKQKGHSPEIPLSTSQLPYLLEVLHLWKIHTKSRTLQLLEVHTVKIE